MSDFNKQQNDDLKGHFEKNSGRLPNAREMGNIESDALALAQFLMQKVAELEDRLGIVENGDKKKDKPQQ